MVAASLGPGMQTEPDELQQGDDSKEKAAVAVVVVPEMAMEEEEVGHMVGTPPWGPVVP